MGRTFVLYNTPQAFEFLCTIENFIAQNRRQHMCSRVRPDVSQTVPSLGGDDCTESESASGERDKFFAQWRPCVQNHQRCQKVPNSKDENFNSKKE
ncbi:hypothetical protein CHS0354_034341 [Potamilus streckersoni]|uniref:Uncharacterized protein n=1 Tax=Potamilus streckersoni TaxID=2493646 RepID=A0AAE0TIA4_9BIVA|nr:hypothetical protein CHS0354_034341 [Potamilus streckersoni]